MLIGIARGLIVVAAALWLAGCSTSNSFSDLLGSKTPSADGSAPQANAEASEPKQSAVETTGTVPPPLGVAPVAEPGLLGSDPYDELSLGKKHYRANDFGRDGFVRITAGTSRNRSSIGFAISSSMPEKPCSCMRLKSPAAFGVGVIISHPVLAATI